MRETQKGNDLSFEIAWPSVLTVAGVLVVFALGVRIPLPGLDYNALLPLLEGGSKAMMSRLSVFALGTMPLLTVLVHVELLRLIVPPFARWQAKSEINARRVTIAVRVLALLIAALQGYGIAHAIEMSGLGQTGGGSFTLTTIACFMASTAVVIWLAETICLPWGISGFWLLMGVSLATSLPGELFYSLQDLRNGGMAMSSLLVMLIFLGISVVLVVFANLLLRRFSSDPSFTDGPPWAMLLWPPFLAGTAGGYLIVLPAIFVSSFLQNQAAIELVVRGLIAVLIPVFVLLYARMYGLLQRPKIQPVLAALMAAQLFVSLGAGLISQITRVPITLDGRLLIVMISVLMTLGFVRFAR